MVDTGREVVLAEGGRTDYAAYLTDLLAPLDEAPVECDGMCRLIATQLFNSGIPYQAKYGTLTLQGRIVSTHFWIEVGPYLIDFRARMWLGDSHEVPHGVFPRMKFPTAVYAGADVEMPPLSPELFTILCIPIYPLPPAA